ncbi:hypothetical protein JTE90_029271 [Oedothorax gibbosus]|uniref:RING-type domain-containing protein n=1 Tax=Oedothorax gibbosus TaxID=931172 RepID=A0AAV6TNE3_9ARAC|nr:hypothetical protein JTE90_029271 [Oedothorax gibbosus]
MDRGNGEAPPLDPTDPIPTAERHVSIPTEEVAPMVLLPSFNIQTNHMQKRPITGVCNPIGSGGGGGNCPVNTFFPKQIIVKWFESHATCPVCRNEIFSPLDATSSIPGCLGYLIIFKEFGTAPSTQTLLKKPTIPPPGCMALRIVGKKKNL